MNRPKRFLDSNVSRWNCMVKVDKNRYAVSGLNQTTDPYTQVIKLVDSQLRPVSTVTFRLPGKDAVQRLESMVMIGKSALLGASVQSLIHVLQCSRMSLTVVQANIEMGKETPNAVLNRILALNKRKAVTVFSPAVLKVIELTFH